MNRSSQVRRMRRRRQRSGKSTTPSPVSFPSPEDFQQFLRLSGVLFVRLDSIGRVTFVNHRMCHLLGVAARDVIGKNWFTHFVPSRLRQQVLKVFRQLVRGRLAPAEFFENPLRTAHGEERIIAWHNALLRDAHGRIIGTLSSGEDITERRLAERRLAESEENLRVTMNSIGDAVLVADPKGRIVHMNPVAEALTAWPLREAIGLPLKTVFRIRSALTGKPLRNPFRAVMAGGTTVGLANHTVLTSRHGRDHHIADTAAPIRSPDGHIRGVVIVFKDVSLDYARSRSLEESEARLRTFFNEAMDGIAVASVRTRRIIEVNPRLLAMTQCRREDFLGATIDVLHPASHLNLVREAFVRVSRQQQHLVMNIPVQRCDGTVFTADINATPMLWNGEKCIVGIFRDITPRQQIEMALRESEAKFRRIIETTPHGVHMYRLQDDGRLVFVGANPAADRILGVRNRDFIGKTIEEAFPPLAEMDIPEAYRTVARTGQPWHSEQVAYQDNQIAGVYDVHAFQTGPFGVAAMFEDVTSRKAIERALRENEQRFRTLVENSPDYILRIDRQARVRLASPALLNLLHLPMEGGAVIPLDELGLPAPPGVADS